MVLFMLGMMMFAVTRGSTMLATMCAVSLACGSLLGHPKAMLFGRLDYTGAIYFSVAMFGVSLEFLAYGSRAACNTTGSMVTGMVFILGSVLFLQNIGLTSPADGAETESPVVRLGTIAVLQPVFAHALRRRPAGPQLRRVLALNAMILVIDTILVLPVTFCEQMGRDDLVARALGSLAMRMAVFAVSVPYLAGFVWLQRRRLVPRRGGFAATV